MLIAPVTTRLALRDGVPVDAVRPLHGRGVRRRGRVRVEARRRRRRGVRRRRGTFGSKPTGAGAAGRRSSAGGRRRNVRVEARRRGGRRRDVRGRRRGRSGRSTGAGAGGRRPGRARGAAFGSMPTASALAVAVHGRVASVPVIAATMSVLRTFFKFFLSRCARQSKPTVWVGCFVPCGIAALGRAVSFWHGSGRARSARRLLPPAAAAVAVRSPAHTRVRGFNFPLRFQARLGLQRTVRDQIDSSSRKTGISVV